MGLSLIAFDTDHIKRYVFGTNKLKEIRGASSILDELNRIVMTDSAKRFGADLVYANGGSGLFLVSNEQADAFETEVKQWYYDKTGGGASVTSVIVPAPEELRNADDDIPNTRDIRDSTMASARGKAAPTRGPRSSVTFLSARV